MARPEPRCPLLDVLHHGLGVGLYGLLGDGEAHVRVDSIFRRVGEQSDSVPVETRTTVEETFVLNVCFNREALVIFKHTTRIKCNKGLCTI